MNNMNDEQKENLVILMEEIGEVVVETEFDVWLQEVGDVVGMLQIVVNEHGLDPVGFDLSAGKSGDLITAEEMQVINSKLMVLHKLTSKVYRFGWENKHSEGWNKVSPMHIRWCGNINHVIWELELKLTNYDLEKLIAHAHAKVAKVKRIREEGPVSRQVLSKRV